MGLGHQDRTQDIIDTLFATQCYVSRTQGQYGKIIKNLSHTVDKAREESALRMIKGSVS